VFHVKIIATDVSFVVYPWKGNYMQQRVTTIPITNPDNPNEKAPEISQLLGRLYPFVLPGRRNDLNKIKTELEAGSMTVGLEIIKRTIQESPAFRGRSIEFPNPSKDEDDIIKNFFIYTMDHPFLALSKVFFPHPKYWFRGFEDFLQFANIPFSATTGACEILFKMVGTIITPNVDLQWRQLFSKKQNNNQIRLYWLLLFLLTLPLWPIGQSLFFVGNAFGYSRRIVDASCNIVSSSLALILDLCRTNKRYNILYPPIFPSIRILIKNELLFIPAELILASSLFPAGEVATFIVSNTPNLASHLLPLAKALEFITTPIAGMANSIFRHLNLGESILAGTGLSSCLAITGQLWSSSINMLVIKTRHHRWWKRITGNIEEEVSLSIPDARLTMESKHNSAPSSLRNYPQQSSADLPGSKRSSTADLSLYLADHADPDEKNNVFEPPMAGMAENALDPIYQEVRHLSPLPEKKEEGETQATSDPAPLPEEESIQPDLEKEEPESRVSFSV
jgi:hypothetical protein